MAVGVSAVRVRTPATSANLGPGFDSLGLALRIHDEVEISTHEGDSVEVTVEGEGAGEVPLDERHLVVRALRATFEAAGEPVPGLRLRCRNQIPHGRGLGSSASAIVAGVAAATALLGGADPGTGELDRERVFQLAADIEGHPDNVAPCVYGGFTVAWSSGGSWRALSQTVSPSLLPVLCVPTERLSTERARGLLPETVPHRDATFTAGRAALLAAAVTNHPELLFDATEDRLHQGYREPAMPESAALVRALRDREGLPAVVSGAGPSVLVLGWGGAVARGFGEDLAEIGRDLVGSIRRSAGTEWHIRPVRINEAGVCIASPHP